MKLVFVGNGLHGPDNYPNPNVGGSVQTWYLSKELAKRGHEVCIIRRSDYGKAVFEGINLIGVNFGGLVSPILPFWNYIFHIEALISKIYFSKKSMEAILRIKPDVICFIDRFTAIFPLYLEMPKIYIIHVPEALDFFKSYSVYGNKLNSVMFFVKKFVESKVLCKVDKIVALNSFIGRYLKKRGYENVCKIPNGIDIEHFSNKGDEGFILYAGRFDWNKNVLSLVRAFAKIHKEYFDYDLYLVGAGPEEEKIRSLVKKYDLQSHVKIIPWVPRNKLIQLMSKCSFFILPSLFEVFPVVLLEVMASGKPVIARVNMGSVEAVMQGQNGFLYKREDELIKYMDLLLSDKSLRSRMGETGRRIVEERYTFSKIAELYEKKCFNVLYNQEH